MGRCHRVTPVSLKSPLWPAEHLERPFRLVVGVTVAVPASSGRPYRAHARWCGRFALRCLRGMVGKELGPTSDALPLAFTEFSRP